MDKRKPKKTRRDAAPKPTRATEVRLRRAGGDKNPQAGAWELVMPRSALDRAEDLEEVEKMISAGEIDVAIDELRWLLGGCPDFIDAHRLLGELALSEGDAPLARGHFGHAFRVGLSAIRQAKPDGPVPYLLPRNRSFLESGKGLIFTLVQLGKRELAVEVVADMLRCDPSDPLAVQKLLDSSPNGEGCGSAPEPSDA